MDACSHTVTPLPGTGWLLAGPVAALFTPGDDDPRHGELARLVSGCASGWELAIRLLAGVDDGAADGWPAFGVAAGVTGGLVVVAHGVDAILGAEPHPAAGPLAVLTVGPGVPVRLGVAEGDPGHPLGELVEGTARAGGVVVVGSGKCRVALSALPPPPAGRCLPQATGGSLPGEGPVSPEAPASQESPVPQETPVPPESPDTTPTLPPATPVPAAPPAPDPSPAHVAGPPSVWVRPPAAPEPVTVSGIDCARGHFNDPAARFCRVCGLAMHQVSRIETRGRRPALGVLVWERGGSDQIETDLVIGREPQADARVASGEAAGLTPAGDLTRLSRVHAEIRLEEWEARLVDRQSANGTFVWTPEQQGWRRLAPGESVTLEAGMRIAFGERVAVYETGSPAF